MQFVDGAYASIEDGPLLENLVVVGGESIQADSGLQLRPGVVVSAPPTGEVSLAIEDAVGSCAAVRVIMSSTMSVEGYEVAIGHPAGLRLDAIDLGAAAIASGADFQKSEVFEGGGTLGVVLDLVEPFAGNVIPPGESLEIARYLYCCVNEPAAGESETFEVSFVDGVLGEPAKFNEVVSGGRTVEPQLGGAASVTCPGPTPPEVCDNGVDDDGDGLTDALDPDCEAAPPEPIGQSFAIGDRALTDAGEPSELAVQYGRDFEVCFFYKSEEDFVAGGPQFDQIQGLSMAVCYPCELTCREDSFDIAGTIVDAIDADFVSSQCDNDPNDGDGCELILGVLVDSLPPFDGKTLPPTGDYLRVGCTTFTAADDEELCGDQLPLTFCDDINGRGNVPIRNLISTENEARTPNLFGADVTVLGRGRFYRADCNFSQELESSPVDIADPAALASYLFNNGLTRFEPPCLDACDCNDDGRLDAADVMCVLQFLFLFGPFPSDPGPGFDAAGQRQPPGIDPTEDKLGCNAGTGCS